MQHQHERGRHPRHWQRSGSREESLLGRTWGKRCQSTYPPLAPCINNAVAEDQPTSCTNEISRSEFLDNCWVWISAVQADQTDGEVGCKSRLLRFRRRCKREGFWISHYRYRG